MEPQEQIETLTFKKIIMTIGNLPSSYVESLSYYECMLWLCNYLENTVIPAVNNNGEAVEELQGLYVQLKNYVDSYFENLDVQQEINNKLDEMASDGTLTNLIKNYVDPIYEAYETQINGEITDFKNTVNGQISSLTSQVQSTVSGSPKGVYATVSALESADPDHDYIYVVTADGKWYYYNTTSTSWVAGGVYQAAEDSTTVADNADKIKYILEESNIIIYGGELGGIGSDGSEVTNTIRARTKYINTSINKKFILTYANTLSLSTIAKDGNGWRWATNSDYTITNIDDGILYEVANSVVALRFGFRNSTDSSANITDSELKSIKVYTKSPLISNLETSVSSLSTGKIGTLEIGGYTYPFIYGGLGNNGDYIYNVIRACTLPIYTKNISNIKLILDSNLVIHAVFGYNNGTWGQVSSYSYNSDTSVLSFSDSPEFLRVVIKHGDNSTITSSEKSNSYVTYNETNPSTYYSGKKYVALGDSITYGFIPRNYTGYPGQLDSFCKLCANDMNMDFTNAGLSGDTVAVHGSITADDAMCRRYVDLDDDADLITFMGGINDFRNGVPLGTFGDTSETTFYGALNILFGGLYKKYFIDQGTTTGKTKKIIIMTPIKNLLSSSDTQGGNGTLRDISTFVEAIKEVAEYYSFPVLDMYNLSGINPHLNQTIQGTETGYTGYYNPYITDGTHPTQEGHYIMSKVLEGFLKTLV